MRNAHTFRKGEEQGPRRSRLGRVRRILLHRAWTADLISGLSYLTASLYGIDLSDDHDQLRN